MAPSSGLGEDPPRSSAGRRRDVPPAGGSQKQKGPHRADASPTHTPLQPVGRAAECMSMGGGQPRPPAAPAYELSEDNDGLGVLASFVRERRHGGWGRMSLDERARPPATAAHQLPEDSDSRGAFASFVRVRRHGGVGRMSLDERPRPPAPASQLPPEGSDSLGALTSFVRERRHGGDGRKMSLDAPRSPACAPPPHTRRAAARRSLDLARALVPPQHGHHGQQRPLQTASRFRPAGAASNLLSTGGTSMLLSSEQQWVERARESGHSDRPSAGEGGVATLVGPRETQQQQQPQQERKGFGLNALLRAAGWSAAVASAEARTAPGVRQ